MRNKIRCLEDAVQILFLFLAKISKAERGEHVASRHVMLAIGLDPAGIEVSDYTKRSRAHDHPPVQSQRMQEGRQALHDTQDGQGEDKPHRKHDDGEDDTDDARLAECALEGHVVQHLGELRVGERQRPEAEVRGAADGV